ncbi:hypothetical protein Tco_0627353 [Tanacetum coccineum]|uniref:Uncharacterized protein n=1 Tax=Tanacetum coccineum TaxID=301880 RepID=A0ABQ4WM54_9ASTR
MGGCCFFTGSVTTDGETRGAIISARKGQSREAIDSEWTLLCAAIVPNFHLPMHSYEVKNMYLMALLNLSARFCGLRARQMMFQDIFLHSRALGVFICSAIVVEYRVGFRREVGNHVSRRVTFQTTVLWRPEHVGLKILEMKLQDLLGKKQSYDEVKTYFVVPVTIYMQFDWCSSRKELA